MNYYSARKAAKILMGKYKMSYAEARDTIEATEPTRILEDPEEPDLGPIYKEWSEEDLEKIVKKEDPIWECMPIS